MRLSTILRLRTLSEAPSPRPSPSSSMLPYVLGGVAGVATAGVAGYALYHFSGAKRVVEKVTVAKERYDGVKASVAEKSDVAREKVSSLAQSATQAAREKQVDLRERWASRLSRGKVAEPESDSPKKEE